MNEAPTLHLRCDDEPGFIFSCDGCLRADSRITISLSLSHPRYGRRAISSIVCPARCEVWHSRARDQAMCSSARVRGRQFLDRCKRARFPGTHHRQPQHSHSPGCRTSGFRPPYNPLTHNRMDRGGQDRISLRPVPMCPAGPDPIGALPCCARWQR